MQRAIRLLVLGIGNPSRTDDGVGHYVVEQLRCHLGRSPADTNDDYSGWSEFPTVQTTRVHQLTPEISLDIKDFDVVVFVDASIGCGNGGDLPGDVDLSPVMAEISIAPVSHHWAAGSILALTAHFFGRAPKGYVLSIPGRDFSFGDALSPRTKEDADRAVRLLAEHIEGWLKGGLPQ